MRGGMQSSPVFARAFGMGCADAEALMAKAGQPQPSMRLRCPCGHEETRIVCADCDHVLVGRAREDGPQHPLPGD